MNEEPKLYYYRVMTKEEVARDHCGEIGDIIRQVGFGPHIFTSVRTLPDGRLEVKVPADAQRIQEIRGMPDLFRACIDAEGEEVHIISDAFLLREQAEEYAAQLIEKEIERLKQKLAKLRQH